MGCKALILMHLSVKSHYFIRTEKMTFKITEKMCFREFKRNVNHSFLCLPATANWVRKNKSEDQKEFRVNPVSRVSYLHSRLRQSGAAKKIRAAT